MQTDTRITITLERNLDKLFGDTEKRDSIPTTDPDASIEFWDRPYIDYQEITLTSIWETYLKFYQILFNKRLKWLQELKQFESIFKERLVN